MNFDVKKVQSTFKKKKKTHPFTLHKDASTSHRIRFYF